MTQVIPKFDVLLPMRREDRTFGMKPLTTAEGYSNRDL